MRNMTKFSSYKKRNKSLKFFIFSSMLIALLFYGGINSYKIFYFKSNNLQINTLSVENITVIFKYKDTLLLNCSLNFTGSQISVFDATINALGGIEHIKYNPDTGCGVFIRDMEINNTWYKLSSNKFWLYWVNGEFAKVSCSKYNLQSNSIIVWIYTDNFPYTSSTDQDYSGEFLIFIVVLISILIGIGVLGIIIKKRFRNNEV